MGFDPSLIAVEVAIFVLLLLLSALISGSEVAVFSLSGSTKEAMAQAADRASRRVLKLLERPRALLITILTLNTLVNVSAAILAAIITGQFAGYLGLSEAVILLIEVVVLTFLLLVISEITPKLIAARNAEVYSRRVSGALLLAYRILAPFSNMLARSMQRLQGRLQPTVTRFSSEDVKAMAEIGEAHGTLAEDERELIQSIVDFGDTAVREVMISRLDIQALPVVATLQEALDLIRDSGFSRLPLYAGHLDSILGILYAKDLLPYVDHADPSSVIDWTRVVREPMFVPQGKKLDDLLREFQARKMHMAIIVDEYGGTAGLITMEDLLEEIVGDIRDEHDEDEEEVYVALDDGAYLCDARMDLDDLNELLDVAWDTQAFDFETLGGLIMHETGSIPNPGDEIHYAPLNLRVETVDNQRIGKVRVVHQPDAAETSTSSDAAATSASTEAERL